MQENPTGKQPTHPAQLACRARRSSSPCWRGTGNCPRARTAVRHPQGGARALSRCPAHSPPVPPVEAAARDARGRHPSGPRRRCCSPGAVLRRRRGRRATRPAVCRCELVAAERDDAAAERCEQDHDAGADRQEQRGEARVAHGRRSGATRRRGSCVLPPAPRHGNQEEHRAPPYLGRAASLGSLISGSVAEIVLSISTVRTT